MEKNELVINPIKMQSCHSSKKVEKAKVNMFCNKQRDDV